MKTNTLCLALMIIGGSVIPTFSFGAYGGGGGGGSSITSSSVSTPPTILERDNCPNGDFSTSYSDGTCVPQSVGGETTNPVSAPLSFSTQSVKKPTSFIFKQETRSKIEQKMKEQQKTIKKELKMPMKYIIIQRKIDVIMDPREMLSNEERLKKAVKLFEKSELILENKTISPKIESIITYVQLRVIKIIQNAGKM